MVSKLILNNHQIIEFEGNAGNSIFYEYSSCCITLNE